MELGFEPNLCLSLKSLFKDSVLKECYYIRARYCYSLPFIKVTHVLFLVFLIIRAVHCFLKCDTIKRMWDSDPIVRDVQVSPPRCSW